MARCLACIALFLGPLAVVEALARDSIEFLLPHMRHKTAAADTKRMLVRLRCPDVLVLGSSMTDRSLIGAFLLGKEIERGREIERPFDFASPGTRATSMYMMWRSVHASGCDPDFVLVEVSPVVLNGIYGEGRRLLDAPFLSAQTLYSLPSGFALGRAYDVANLAEFVTFERLLIHRRRDEIQAALLAWSGLAPSSDPTPEPFPLDGKLTARQTAPMSSAGAFERERSERLDAIADGSYTWRLDDVERAALLALIEEASAAGSRVILHTPPVTEIYRNAILELDEYGDWCAFVRELSQVTGVEWFNDFSAPGYDRARFHDWVHLSPRGARRYIQRLLAAIRERNYPSDPYCR